MNLGKCYWSADREIPEFLNQEKSSVFKTMENPDMSSLRLSFCDPID